MIDATSGSLALEGFRALGDPTRLRIVRLLEGGSRCVCEIQRDLPDVAPNLLSHHLRVLREAGLVSAHKRGRWVDYALRAEGWAELRQALPVLCKGSRSR